VIISRRFLISGRVQGVGFRFFVREAAARENLGGFARNLDDGRVEVVVSGDQEAVQRLERQVRRGPPAARVEHVDVFEEAPPPSPTRFRIDPTT
jgi:acylphosphatase